MYIIFEPHPSAKQNKRTLESQSHSTEAVYKSGSGGITDWKV